MIAAPVTLATAAGPWIGAVLADLLNGYVPMFLLLGSVGILAALIGLATMPARVHTEVSAPDAARPRGPVTR